MDWRISTETLRGWISALFNEIRELHKQLLLDISRNCDHYSLARYLYTKRKGLIDSLFISGFMPSIQDLITLNEFLLILNNLTIIGKGTDLTYFESLYQRMKKALKQLNDIEDIQNFRYLLATKPDMALFRMKYLYAIMDVYKSYGIVSSSYADLADVFSFLEIQELASDDGSEKQKGDMADFLEEMWLFTLAMRYIFSTHYRTSKQYDYKVDSIDMAVLLSFLYSIKEQGIIDVSLNNAIRHYQCQQNNKPFDEFIGKYISNSELIPIMIRVDDRITMDRNTLMFFVLYLFGQNTTMETTTILSGKERILRKREKSGQFFESKIRQLMADQEYKGPDQPIVEKYEYDILKLKESKKRIIIADAKFHDISPSSISGRTLIKQELLESDQGLIEQSERQSQRLEYFISNKEDFRKYLYPNSDWAEYEINAYLITKYTPLIDSYRKIEILPYKKFISEKI